MNLVDVVCFVKGERETRGFDASSGQMNMVYIFGQFSVRMNRFMPEPDLPSLSLSDSYLSQLGALMPELPDDMSVRWQKEYNLSPADTCMKREHLHKT